MKRISVTLLLAAAAIAMALWVLEGRAGFQDAPSQPDPSSIPVNRPEVFIPFAVIISAIAIGGGAWAYFQSKKTMTYYGEKPWY